MNKSRIVILRSSSNLGSGLNQDSLQTDTDILIHSPLSERSANTTKEYIFPQHRLFLAGCR